MKELEAAIKLRAEGKLKESNTLLINLVKEFPHNSQVNYQCAWSFDVLGLEREAIPYYEKSRDVFLKGLEVFPEDNAIKTFHAMTLYNLGDYSEAMKILLINLAATSADENIKQYEKAIRFYAEDLNKIW
jgi:tetratricopeptide (TPR) repeat protein